MAIHVKPVSRARYILLHRLRKTLLLAGSAAVLIIFIGAIILYFQFILIEQESSTTFTNVFFPQEQKLPEPPQEKDRGLSGGGSPPISASITPNVIVSTSVSNSYEIQPIPDSLGEGLGMAEMGGFDFGFGLSGSGTGSGVGTGSGEGRGNGRGRGSGSGGGGRGLNDDIQVVLALDASGSMDELFTAVAGALQSVLSTLGSAKLDGQPVKVNLGIVVYGQNDNNGAPFVLSRFTTKVNTLKELVSETACDGSIEECGAALMVALKRFPWNMRERDDMLKVIFICGNEPFDMGKVDYRTAMAQARAANIIVNTVYCGSTDAQWEEAARLGNGVGLSFIAPPARENTQNSDQLAYEALIALHKIPLLPTGSPAIQRRLQNEHRSGAPPRNHNSRQATNWLRTNRRPLINGYDWDAVEICRRRGPTNFSLQHIGGRGNLPLSLRGKSDHEAEEYIRELAEKREELLQTYRSYSNVFAEQILETLQEQAQQKGIIIEL